MPAWKKRLPMWATSVRFVAAPFFFVFLWMSQKPGHSNAADWASAVLFILASLTDWLDGYWARKYDAQTTMGKFMDPIADKILVLSALVVLLHIGRVDPLMVALLMSRDIFIGGIRSVAAADGVIIAAKPTGKWKTAFQMIGIPCLFLADLHPALPTERIGYWILWASVVLSLKSGWDYTRGYFLKEPQH